MRNLFGFIYSFVLNIMSLHVQYEPELRILQFVVSHHVKRLCTLKSPDEGDGAVAMDQVGVRLFAAAAFPLLHHIIIPLIITLQRNTCPSHTVHSVHSSSSPEANMRQNAPLSLTARKYSLQSAVHVVSKTKVMRDSSVLSLSLTSDCGSLWTHMTFHHTALPATYCVWSFMCDPLYRNIWLHLYPGTLSMSIRKSVSWSPGVVYTYSPATSHAVCMLEIRQNSNTHHCCQTNNAHST